MTVTSKLDIVSPDQRGVATGFNEFAGYGGVALAGLITGSWVALAMEETHARINPASEPGL